MGLNFDLKEEGEDECMKKRGGGREFQITGPMHSKISTSGPSFPS